MDIENLDKSEHYNIPENYFDELPQRVIKNIRKEESKKRTILTTSVAAVAIALIAGTFFFTYNAQQNGTSVAKQANESNISADEALEYVASDYYSEELAQMDYYNAIGY